MPFEETVTIDNELKELIYDFNRTKGPLGSQEKQPYSLCTTSSIVLNSPFPMLLFRGQDHICIYNESSMPVMKMNGSHPPAPGSPAKKIFHETWPQIQPPFSRMLNACNATDNEDEIISLFENNKIKDTCKISYTESGKPGGILVTFTWALKHNAYLCKLNEELNKKNSELVASNTELEEFTYITSHDLQKPLGKIILFLNQLQTKYRDQLDATAQKFIIMPWKQQHGCVP